MTVITVLQCVEKGKISLETDVTFILHESNDLKILTGFDESAEPFLKEKAGCITVQLFTGLLLFRISLTQRENVCSRIPPGCRPIISMPYFSDGVISKGKRLLLY